MNSFTNSAGYYDFLYQDKDYDLEVNYIKQIIKQYTNSFKSILEIGCGTGNYSIRFIEKDIELFGIDLSQSMVDIAEKKKNVLNAQLVNNLTFQQANVCNMNFDKQFDVAISLFHVISYLKTNEELLQAFKNINKSLNSKGLFIFDCWYGPAVLTDRPYIRSKTFTNDEIKIERTSNPIMYPNDNIVDVNYRYEIKDKTTDCTKEFSELHSMRYYFKPELELLLNITGFSILNYFEFMTSNKASLSTWNVCFVCQKN